MKESSKKKKNLKKHIQFLIKLNSTLHSLPKPIRSNLYGNIHLKQL